MPTKKPAPKKKRGPYKPRVKTAQNAISTTVGAAEFAERIYPTTSFSALPSAIEVRAALQATYPRGYAKKGNPYLIVDNEREEIAAVKDGYSRLQYLSEAECQELKNAEPEKKKDSAWKRFWTFFNS